MSQPKWKPGEYTLDPDGLIQIVGPDNLVAAEMLDDPDDEQAMALARLFTISPKLYWQLEEAKEILEIAYLKWPDPRVGAQAIAIGSLLAETRGESQTPYALTRKAKEIEVPRHEMVRTIRDALDSGISHADIAERFNSLGWDCPYGRLWDAGRVGFIVAAEEEMAKMIVKRQVELDGSEYTTFGEDESTFPPEVREEMAEARRRLLED